MSLNIPGLGICWARHHGWNLEGGLLGSGVSKGVGVQVVIVCDVGFGGVIGGGGGGGGGVGVGIVVGLGR